VLQFVQQHERTFMRGAKGQRVVEVEFLRRAAASMA